MRRSLQERESCLSLRWSTSRVVQGSPNEQLGSAIDTSQQSSVDPVPRAVATLLAPYICIFIKAREAAARDELKAAQAAQLAAQATPAELSLPGAPPSKKEAFKGGISLGVCANALCLCGECECDAVLKLPPDPPKIGFTGSRGCPGPGMATGAANFSQLARWGEASRPTGRISKFRCGIGCTCNVSEAETCNPRVDSAQKVPVDPSSFLWPPWDCSPGASLRCAIGTSR